MVFMCEGKKVNAKALYKLNKEWVFDTSTNEAYRVARDKDNNIDGFVSAFALDNGEVKITRDTPIGVINKAKRLVETFESLEGERGKTKGGCEWDELDSMK